VNPRDVTDDSQTILVLLHAADAAHLDHSSDAARPGAAYVSPFANLASRINRPRSTLAS